MIGLGVLVLVVLLGVAWGFSRRSHPRSVTGGAAPTGTRPDDLARWIDAGLLSADQADAIRAFERARTPVRPPARVSPVVELLAYIGGVLLAVGTGMLVGSFWSDLGTAGHLSVLGAAGVLTGVVGLAVGEADPVTWRLRGFLWALTAAATAGFAGLVAFEVADLRGEPVALAATAAGGGVSLLCWWLRERPLQHLLAFAGAAGSVGVAVAWAGGSGLLVGVALWVLGAAWAALGWRELVPPGRLGLLLGIALTLVGSGATTASVEWLAPLLGLATAAAWLGLGVVHGDRLALVPATLGVFLYLPWTLGYFFGDQVGAPVVAMTSGAVLLGVVLLLVRRGRDHERPRPTSGRHLAAHP